MRSSIRLARVATALGAAALLVGISGVLGCGTQCERNPEQPPIVYKGGITDRAKGTYYSSEISGPYLPFPPGRTYRFIHGLMGQPQDVQAWLSFAEGPIPEGDPDGFVQPAGNQVTFEHVTTEYVDVRNDTCSDVRIRIKARDPLFTSVAETDASAPAVTGPSGDAGG